jgi:hypothetical protein
MAQKKEVKKKSGVQQDSKGRFVKGNSSGGRKPLPESVKKARALAFEVLIKNIIEVRNMTTGQADKKLNDSKTTLGERAIISAFVEKEYKQIEYYENRLFGKPKDNIDLTAIIEGDALPIQINIKPVPVENTD